MKKWFYLRMDESGRGSFRVRRFGGEMTVRGKHSHYAWFYVREVNQHELRLPEDADIIATDQTVVRFRLTVPQDRLPEGATRLWVLVERDDWVPVTHVDPRVFTGLREYRMGETVELTYLPGHYYVGYVDGPSSQPTIIGTINITPDSDGKTISVVPLTK